MKPPAPRLTVTPDQFFRHEPVSLSCGSTGNWTVVRNTSTDSRQPCGPDWGRMNGSVCEIEALYSDDNGLYWCERDGHHSAAVNITVHEQRATESPTSPTIRASSSGLLVPLLYSILGPLLLLLLLLMLLLLWVKYCKRKPNESLRDGTRTQPEADEITYSDILHHRQRRPITRPENVQSPVYSSVKTEEIQYSSVNIKTRGKGRVRRTEKENVQSPVYSSVKTEEIQYSSVNIKTRGKGRVRRTEKEENPVYSSVKTQDVCHSPIIINETRDAASWTKGRKTETK